jgi:hypothetical protein
MTEIIGGAIGLLVLGLFGWIAKGRIESKERERVKDEAQQDAARRVVKGREQMRDGRGADPDVRVRGNDPRW